MRDIVSLLGVVFQEASPCNKPLMVRQPYPPPILPHLSYKILSLPRVASVPALAPPGCIFAGIHSGPGDIVDALTRSGSFAFLSDLFYTESLFELPDFRIARVMPKVRPHNSLRQACT